MSEHARLLSAPGRHDRGYFFAKEKRAPLLPSPRSQRLESIEEQHILNFLRLPWGQAMVLFAGIVGLVSGAAAFIFYWLINVSVRVFLLAHPASASSHPLKILGTVLSPAVGGLVCGLLIHTFAPDAQGGVAEVIDALLHRDGTIRGRVGFFKALASAICIGSGGSAGREGPVVQIGASVGSALGRAFGATKRRAQLLVACGAAGGIAAVFNAPIAGAFFAAEIVTGRFEMRDLSLLFTASAMGAVVANALLRGQAIFQVPAYHLLTAWTLGFHVLLGVLCALAGHLFILALHACESIFHRIRLHTVLKPALGGLLVGLIGLLIPQVFGTGGELLRQLFALPPAATILLVWLLGKLIATSLTLGSGGSGGDLMPSLFLGATVGGAVGHLAHHLFPHSTMPPGAYALVGATALFAGVAHAPMTAIILGFEMGRDYGIVIPLLIACSISALVSAQLRTASLYTQKLKEKGVDIERLRGGRVDLLDTIPVEAVMDRNVPTVPPDLPVPELLDRFAATGHHGFVVAQDDRLKGIVTLSDAQKAIDGTEASRRVEDIATVDPIVCYPSDTVKQALWRLGTREVGRIPVVSETDPTRVVGLLRRSDVLRAYSASLAQEGRRDESDSAGSVPAPLLQRRWREPQQGRLVPFTVSARDWFRGQRVRDLKVPPGCLFVSIRRGRRTVVPSGQTVLRPDDHVTAFVGPDAQEVFQQWLSTPPSDTKSTTKNENPV
ncbi:MAG TPA: chloride channel protein [Chthonomonadaceae bacterium]|nr:chloride channel protein [Chthonomonadaceae bacterium]